MLCAKSATVCFRGKLEPRFQKTWSLSWRVRVHFYVVMATGENGVVPTAPFHLLVIEIILLSFDALRGKAK